MFRINLTEEPKGQIYEKLIDYACKHSDSVMLVTYWHKLVPEEEYKLPGRDLYKNEIEYLSNLTEHNKYIKKRVNEQKSSIKIFENFTVPFLRQLKPFLIKKRVSPSEPPFIVEWPSTITHLSEYTKVEISFYKICKEINNILKERNGLFQMRYPYFPEDISFFSTGYCWFSTCSHDKSAEIYLKSVKEVEELKKQGCSLEIEEIKNDELSLFFEEYYIK